MKNTRAGRPLPMILLLIPFLCLVVATPFGDPVQTVLEVSYLCVIVGITIWETTRPAAKTDEVEVAAARFSVSAGTYAGILSMVGFLIVLTRVPAVAELIATLAESRASNLPPAAAGFGLGALTAILLIFISAIITYGGWSWRTSRR